MVSLWAPPHSLVATVAAVDLRQDEDNPSNLRLLLDYRDHTDYPSWRLVEEPSSFGQDTSSFREVPWPSSWGSMHIDCTTSWVAERDP